MKYLVLFMESEEALPIDMLSRPIHPDGKLRPNSAIAQLLAKAEHQSHKSVNTAAINGYTTIDVRTSDEAAALAKSWNWCGGVHVLPLDDSAISA